MLPDPLHPALVHFPIVLAMLAPLLAGGFFWAIQTRRLPARAWIAVVALQAVVFGSAWLTAETGEEEEDRVEHIVGHDPIEEHEEAAEWFIWITAITLPVAGAGILAGSPGTGARALAVAGTLLAALAVARVGHTGGELVYEHGAALAYLDGPTAAKVLARKAVGNPLLEALGGGAGGATIDSERADRADGSEGGGQGEGE